MSLTLYLTALTLGAIIGWQGCLAVTAFVTRRRDKSSGPVEVVDTITPSRDGGTGLELDLRDNVVHDWRRDDPDIAACPACRGRGRLWLFDQGAGRAVHCPCGTPAATQQAAER